MACTDIETGTGAKIRYLIQTTCGEIPANPVWKELKRTSAPMQTNRDQLTDDTIGLLETEDITGGNINTQIAVEANMRGQVYDDLIQAGMQSTWAAVLNVASTAIDADTTDDSFNGVGLFAAAEVGMTITVSGFTDPANNGTFVILTASADKITVNADLVTEAAGNSVTITSDEERIAVGDVKTKIAVEYYYPVTGIYRRVIDMEISDMSFNVAVNSLVTASFTLTGGTLLAKDTAPLAGATYPTITEKIYNSFTGGLYINGTINALVSSINPAMAKNSTVLYAIGSRYPIGVSQGRRNITMSVVTYFVDSANMDRTDAETEFALRVDMQSTGGSAYHKLVFPRVKSTNHGINDQEQELTETMEVTALKDTTTGTSFELRRGGIA